MSPTSRLQVAALLGLIGPLAATTPPSASIATAGVSAVAIVLTDGKLLPLAAGSGGAWNLLPWPQHESESGEAAPAIPGTVETIPKEWFAPLPTLPTVWRLRPIGGRERTIHSGLPTRWAIATFDAIGLSRPGRRLQRSAAGNGNRRRYSCLRP